MIRKALLDKQNGRKGKLSILFCVFVLGVLLGDCSAWRPGPAENGAQGRRALREGDYGTAKQSFEAALRADPKDEPARIGLLEVLRETGSYEEGLKRGAQFIETGRNSAGLHCELGRLEAATGDYAAAERSLRRARELGGAAGLDAARELGVLLEDILGRRQDALSLWNELLAQYRKGLVKGSGPLGDVAFAAWRLNYVQDARDIFLDATTEETAGGDVSLEALTGFGRLFLEKYNATDAMGVFKDCLAINKSYPPALLGMAEAKKYESSSEVENYARTALEVNPSMVPALNLLAELRLQEEDYGAALESIRKALAVNPSDLESLSLEAVYYRLQEKASEFEGVEERILGINPLYGRLYYTLAENMVMRRKYKEAVDLNRQAVGLDPRLYSAYAGLGINLMRIGEIEEGRKMIELAFEGDPFNVWAFNTLDLLDQMDKFVQTRSEHFVFKMAREDEAVLSPYASKLAEEAYSSLSKRYGFVPSGPLQFEIFPDHGGFAVRTLGLPGLGALGVCFGKVVALDSPRARKEGAFNWGSTLWHEFTHVMTLQMTRHNIPRWYSEGLSVYEERRARTGWGDDLTAPFVRAYQEGNLLKISELNAGMMRPKSPEQVSFSYFQAALFCEMVEEKFGFAKIRDSLELFAQGKTTEEVFSQVLGWDTATLDREYAAYLDEKLKPAARNLDFKRIGRQGAAGPDKRDLTAAVQKNPDDFFANLQLGALLLSEKAYDEAEAHLIKAEILFPEFVEPGNAYQLLGQMYDEQKREDEALGQYLAWSRYDETALPPLKRAGEIYRKRKAWTEAVRMFELSVYVYPYDPDIHSELGKAAMESGDWPSAVAAFQVLLGLNPPDPAAAHFDLARAWLGWGKRQEARREVLRALEIAPSYEAAQQLLLDLAGGVPK